MQIQTCQLDDFLESREIHASDSNAFLIGLAKMLNETIIANDLSWKLPTGIEGCMELLEKYKDRCQMDLHIEDDVLVGFNIDVNDLITYVEDEELDSIEDDELDS